MRLLVAVFACLVLLSTAAFALDRSYKNCVAGRSGQVCGYVDECCLGCLLGQATYLDKGMWITPRSVVKNAERITVNGHPAEVILMGCGEGCQYNYALIESYTPSCCYWDPCTCCYGRVDISPTRVADNLCCWDTFYADLTKRGTFIKQEWLYMYDYCVVTSTEADRGTAGAGMFLNGRCGQRGLVGMVVCGYSEYRGCKQYRTSCIVPDWDEIYGYIDNLPDK